MAQGDRQRFEQDLAKRTGLRPDVIRAWVSAEGGGPGRFNYLNVRGFGKSYSGVPVSAASGGFSSFQNVDQAAHETAWWINHMPNFKGIRQAAKTGDAQKQLGAIIASPWDEGHYGGGQNLLDRWLSIVSGGPGDIPGAAAATGAAQSAAGAAKTAAGGAEKAAEAVFNLPHEIAGAIEWAAGSVWKGLLEAVLFGVLLLLAAGLVYTGLRRLSGDRLPSGREIGQTIAMAAA